MDLLSTTEAAQKMGHLIQLRAAVERATVAGKMVQAESGHWHRHYTPEQAVALQQRRQELAGFISTMRPRLVQ
jgi:hypothetical protein